MLMESIRIWATAAIWHLSLSSAYAGIQLPNQQFLLHPNNGSSHIPHPHPANTSEHHPSSHPAHSNNASDHHPHHLGQQPLDGFVFGNGSYLDQYCAMEDQADNCSTSGRTRPYNMYCVWNQGRCESISHDCPLEGHSKVQAMLECGASPRNPCPNSCREPMKDYLVYTLRSAGITDLNQVQVPGPATKTARWNKTFADDLNCWAWEDLRIMPQCYDDATMTAVGAELARDAKDSSPTVSAAAAPLSLILLLATIGLSLTGLLI